MHTTNTNLTETGWQFVYNTIGGGGGHALEREQEGIKGKDWREETKGENDRIIS